RERAALAEAADAAVLLGLAPDGLPLALLVQRAAPLTPSVRAALGVGRDVVLPPEVAGALERLEQAVEGAACAAGLVPLDGRRAYRSASPLAGLFGETLLARLLGGYSPLPLPD